MPRFTGRVTGAAPVLILAGARNDAETVPDLARLVRRHGPALAGPTRFTAEIAGDHGETAWCGVLLPYADDAGQIVAVEVVATRWAAADDFPHWNSRMTGGPPARTGVRGAAGNPWRLGGSAADHAVDDRPHDPWSRLEDARTWLALAAANPACRAQALPRALAAIAAMPTEGSPAGLPEAVAATRADRRADPHDRKAGRMVLFPLDARELLPASRSVRPSERAAA